MHKANWTEIRQHFHYDSGALVDIFFKEMNAIYWKDLIKWLENHPSLENVNWYDPESDLNFDHISANIYSAIAKPGFYFNGNLVFGKLTLVIHYYIENEIECDINPEAIRSEADFEFLIGILDKIAALAHVARYSIQPEASDFLIYERALN